MTDAGTATRPSDPVAVPPSTFVRRARRSDTRFGTHTIRDTRKSTRSTFLSDGRAIAAPGSVTPPSLDVREVNRNPSFSRRHIRYKASRLGRGQGRTTGFLMSKGKPAQPVHLRILVVDPPPGVRFAVQRGSQRCSSHRLGRTMVSSSSSRFAWGPRCRKTPSTSWASSRRARPRTASSTSTPACWQARQIHAGHVAQS